jgi:RNA polymerase sigma-70 factor (ECF subfamily)
VTDHREDRELTARMSAGDEAAFDAFAERFTRPLYRFALSRLGGDRDLTGDIVQTTLTRALTRIDTYRGEASLLTWLTACCRNEIRMLVRRRGTAPVAVELDAASLPAAAVPRPPDGSPESSLLSREAASLVHAALDAIPVHYARALEWKYLERLPVQAIAERLSLHPKAAESLLTRAREAFRRAYRELGGETAPQPGAPDHVRARAAT